MHWLALMLLTMYLITMFVLRYLKVPSRKSLLKNKWESYIQNISKCIDFERDIQLADKVYIPKAYKEINKSKSPPIIEIIQTILLMLFDIIYGSILWAVDKNFKTMKPEEVKLESSYAQGVYFPLSWIIIISYTLMLIWFRKVLQNDLKINYKLYILAAISMVVILVWAVIYASAVLKDKPVGTRIMITSAFLVVSFWFLSILMFYIHWSKNGYAFYKRHKFSIKSQPVCKVKKQRRNTQIHIEEVKINQSLKNYKEEKSEESNYKSDNYFNQTDNEDLIDVKLNETLYEMVVQPNAKMK